MTTDPRAKALEDIKPWADAKDWLSAVEAVVEHWPTLEAALTSGWQPIETAPHEVTVLKAWKNTQGEWQYATGYAAWGKMFDNGYSNRCYDSLATHWREITPPTTKVIDDPHNLP